MANSIEAFRIEFGEDGKGSLIFVESEYGPQAGVSRTSMTSAVSFLPSSIPLILFVHFLGQMVEDGEKDGSGNCFAGGEGEGELGEGRWEETLRIESGKGAEDNCPT